MQKWIYYTLLFSSLLFSCGENKQEVIDNPSDLKAIKERDTLRVATLPRSISFFTSNEQNMGYEYELAERFAKSLGVEIKIIIARDLNDLVEKLVQKEVDLIAYPLIISNEFKEKVRYTEHLYLSKQFLIQPSQKEKKRLPDVTGLIGKEVYVVENSKYHHRLLNLNNEIGGGILIRTVANETDEEKLIEMVAKGEIPLTVADGNIANINKTRFSNIDISLPVSLEQRAAWAVGLDSPELYTAVNEWTTNAKNNYIYQYLHHKYFEKKKNNNRSSYINNHKISVFDDLFKKYAPKIGWDWRLLASIAYQESNFNPDIESRAGAMGLMQLMPRTASLHGVKDAGDPKQNVKAAVSYLQVMNRTFSYIEDKTEREKFVLASYNAGIGHIKDAIALTEKHNKNPEKWDDNVAEYILLKSTPEYFNDSIVKFGYLRGEEVYKFVDEVLERYKMYTEVIKK